MGRKIRKKEKEEKMKIQFSLNKKFYNEDAIKEALKDFNEVCCGDYKKIKGKFLITLKSKNEKHSELLKDEFCNYVLALMKNKALV